MSSSADKRNNVLNYDLFFNSDNKVQIYRFNYLTELIIKFSTILDTKIYN